jgi:hypothetical protein
MVDKQEIIRSTKNVSSSYSALRNGLEFIIGILDQVLATVNEDDVGHDTTSTHDDDDDDQASNHQEQQQQQQVPSPSPRLLVGAEEEEAHNVPLNLVLVEDRDTAFLDVVDVLAAGEDEEDEDALPRTNPAPTTTSKKG